MARDGERRCLALLLVVVGLAISLAGKVPLAASVGRPVVSQEFGKGFDGVFPCSCSWNACSSLVAGENYTFSSTCYLPSTHEGSTISIDHSSRNSDAAESGRSYCSVSQQHSLCRFSPDQAAPTCGQVLTLGVSREARAEALRIHNELRAKVAAGGERRGRPGPQPSAADMMMLEWDEELASTAQAWANQCVFQHDCGDCRRTERFVVGQNLYLSGGTGANSSPDWRQALTAFYDEVQLMSSDQVRAFSGAGGVGHYTQLVWGTTRYVGCGYIQYKDSSFTQSYYACNYGSAGNYVGRQIYQEGPTCSKCPAQTSCSTQYPGLCTAENIEPGSGEVSTEDPQSGGGRVTDDPESGGGDSRPSCGMYNECELVYENRAPAGGKFVVLHCQ